ncbi:hypothetical protein DENIS_2305 [Desulfonema ishimotonii]|uniref:Uncharacterized protein n=1 Tax=Desulfonema ishimotonii TaxID=45657 RepID=A0A401FWJ8_9BACT|nr:hypothetical protein [Desulfonema ishimotonii]GBC61345.1 hypothetical protein DENIS_2305 [Desulfonema ishimotonii]
MRESNYMTGKVRILLTDGMGTVLQERQVRNMIVNSGRKLMADLFAGTSAGDPVRYMGIGTGDAATTAGMTGLASEISHLTPDQSPRTLVDAQITEPAEGAIITVTAAFNGEDFIADDAGELSLQEAGLFTEDAEGTMYNRVTFDPIPLRRGYEITLIWDVTFPAVPLATD